MSEPSGLNEFIAPELNEQKYGSVGQQAVAGLEGVARGVTLGGSDLAETRLFGVPSEEIKGRSEANPVTSTVGDIGGGAALIGLTGGLAAPAEAAVGGAGLAASALAAGGEGALFGAGSAVSDYALGDPNLNAQKVLSDIGIGAALGVGAGLIGHGISSVAGKFGNAKGSLAETVAKEANSSNQAHRMAEVISDQAGLKAEAPDIMAAAEHLNLPVMNGMVSDNPWVQKAEDALLNGAPTYSGIKRANMYADAHNGVIDSLNSVVPEAENGLSKAQVGSAMQDSITNQIAEENKPISDLYEAIKEHTKNIPLSDKSAPSIARNILSLDEVRISPSSPEASLAKRVAEEISNLQNVDDVKSYRAILNRSVSPTASSGEKRMAAIISDKLVNWEESSIERYATGLRESVEANGDPEKQEIFRPLVEQIDSLLEQKKIANAQYKPFIEKIGTLAEQLGKKRVYGPQDAINFIQDLTPEQITQKLFSKNNSKFLDFFSKEFPQQMALMREYQKGVLRDAATKTGTFSPKVLFNKINELEPEIQKAIFFPEELKKLKAAETYYRSFPKNFNPSGTSGMSAFREFFHSPTGALLSNARDFGIEQFIRTMGALPEGMRPNPLQAGAEMAERFNKFNAIRVMAERTEKRVYQGINAIAAGGPVAAAPVTNLISHSYDQKVDRIKELAENPEVLTAHTSNHIDGISTALPNVSQGVASSISMGVNFLNSKVPRPKNQLPLSPTWKPSEPQKQKFDRYYDAVDDPVGALKQIKDGSLTSETMEALKVVHPDLLKHMQGQLLAQVGNDRAKTLSYHTRQSISMFLGRPLDESMLQPVRLANQSALSMPQQMPSQRQMSGSPSAGGMKQLKLAGRLNTQTHRDENQQP